MQQFEEKHKLSKCSIEELSALVLTKADNEEMTKYYMRRDKLYTVK
jgi:hypothetical protein